MTHLFVNANRKLAKINRNIYGHFVEHLGRGVYGGFFVGNDSPIRNVRGIRTDVAAALRDIRVPVIRWPGGCFAEYYHWQDGIGSLSGRKHIVNAGWGGVIEDNSFGTHEFFDFCEQIGCDAYLAGNVGSGSVRETSDWVEYVTFAGQSPMADLRCKNGRKEPWPLRFFGVGNENWGGGGRMRAEYYSDEYRRFAAYIRKYGDNAIKKIACGPDGPDYEWTETLMRLAGKHMDGMSLHYYTMPGYYKTDPYPNEAKCPALGFDEANYYRTLSRALYMDELIRRHKCVMDRYDDERRVSIVVDEWGAWHQAESGSNPAFLFQQNTMRDAMVAAVSLNIFNTHSDRVTMANLAQMVNVLQSLILTEGIEMVLTPTYYVFELYKGHQDAALLESYVQQNQVGTSEAQVPALHASASEDADGRTRITLANLSATDAQTVRCIVDGRFVRSAYCRYIAGKIDSHNAFGKPPQVAIQTLPVSNVAAGEFTAKFPACCVAEIVID